MANDILKIAIGGVILAGGYFFSKESGVLDTLKNNFDSLVSSFKGDGETNSAQQQEAPGINSNPNNEETTGETTPLEFDDGNQQEETTFDLPPGDFETAKVSIPNTTSKTQKTTKASSPVITLKDASKKVQTGLDTEQVFIGGGESFIGGTVRETPDENLSLNKIIQKYNVSASKANDIRAKARDDFGTFNFGTNTGLGQKVKTTNKGGERVSNPNERLRVSEEARRIENEKAKEIFDSGSISNF